MSQTDTGQIRVGADVGGTFTDVILIDGDGRIWSQKVPSTPPHFEQAVLDATAHLLRERAAAADTAVDAIGARVAEVAQLEEPFAVPHLAEAVAERAPACHLVRSF